MIHLPKWAFDPLLALAGLGTLLSVVSWWTGKPLDPPLNQLVDNSVLFLVALILNRKNSKKKENENDKEDSA